MKRRFLLGLLLVFAMFIALPVSLNAAEIGPGGFVTPTIYDYNGLGLPVDNTTPIILGGNTHTTDNNDLRYLAFGSNNCVSGECIGSDTDTGFIDIVLTTPVLRAGGWVGVSSGNVQFFDESDALLGTVQVSPVISVSMVFAGWEADAGQIKRIRINDTEINGFIITFDNLTTEEGQVQLQPVPTMNEWGMAIFMVLAGIGSLYYLRRQKRTES
jgi:hypothetical protein